MYTMDSAIADTQDKLKECTLKNSNECKSCEGCVGFDESGSKYSYTQSEMFVGDELAQCFALISKNERYTFALQSDGNLVLYDKELLGGSHVVWEHGRCNVGVGPYLAKFTSSGDVVVSDANEQFVWSTGVADKKGDHLVVEDEGCVVMYNSDGKAVWKVGSF